MEYDSVRFRVRDGAYSRAVRDRTNRRPRVPRARITFIWGDDRLDEEHDVLY